MTEGSSKKAIEIFHEVVGRRHDYARDWKSRTGGKVLGYFCTYVPEELVYAAGILPVRILGSHEPQDVSERHIYTMYCPFCRDCLAQGLKGRYDYLDGVITAHSCVHIRQAFGSWTLHLPVSYSHYVSMPTKPQDPAARPYLAAELALLKQSLEPWTGKAISESDINRAIEVYNTNRRLMRQVYELRRAKSSPLTGVEAMEMVLSSMVSDKEEHNRWLTRSLEEFSQRGRGLSGIRLILIGSEDDDTEFVRLVESMGGLVVIDDHCTGSRYFWNQVILDGDPLSAIADRYLSRPPCPAKDYQQRMRWPHILKLVEDYGIQGAIIIQQKFCDPHEFDIPPLMELLRQKGVPSLHLEFDVTVPAGQFRTRIEAFLEMLEPGLV
jgi:benzoyl-CoA reductase subunit C